jgi:hypothetical protein
VRNFFVFFVTPEADSLSATVMGLVLTRFSRATFIFVEILIAVATIAFLAAIIVPGVFILRKRRPEIPHDLRPIRGSIHNVSDKL